MTVCTTDREPLLWETVGADIIRPCQTPLLSSTGRLVQEGIEGIAAHYENVRVDTYCIMPDHIHMILLLEKPGDGRMVSAPTLSTVVGSMKRWVSRKAGRPVWQKSFFDHGIRGRQDYEEIWTYIQNNPAKYLSDGGR